MPDPPEPVDAGDDEDEIAELLLADALVEPATGDPTTPPDMGVPVTQPVNPPTPSPAPPAPPVPAPPVPAPPNPAPAPPAPPPAPPTPAPAPVPQFVAPVPAPGQPASGTGTDPDVFNYPENTALNAMTVEQRSEYWRHKARKHEDRVKALADYDQLKAQAAEYQKLVEAQQTEHERAVAEARRQGHATALAEAGGQLVEQWVRAASAGRLQEESVNALLQGLDRSRFLTTAGGVDTDKVYALVNSIAPAVPASGVPGQPPQPGQPAPVPQPLVSPPRAPDFGQGQPSTPKPRGLAAGREIARQRFGTPSTSAPAQ